MTSPFDERAALDELERFRQEIERERARRKAVSDQFESFIQSFKKPAPAAERPAAAGQQPIEQPRPPAPALGPVATPVAPPQAAPPPAPTPVIGPKAAPPAPTPVAAPKAAPPPPVHRPAELPRIELPRETPLAPSSAAERDVFITPGLETSPAPRRRSNLAIGLVALFVVAAAIVCMLWRPAAPPESTSTELPPAAEPGPAPGAPPAGVPGDAPAASAADSQPTPPAAAAAPAGTELTTIRTVWVRIIVDGERVLERELPADSRIPLTPTKTIVIRTGDAGAVRLTIRGEDQGFLGREGQVVTRTFTVPGS